MSCSRRLLGGMCVVVAAVALLAGLLLGGWHQERESAVSTLPVPPTTPAAPTEAPALPSTETSTSASSTPSSAPSSSTASTTATPSSSGTTTPTSSPSTPPPQGGAALAMAMYPETDFGGQAPIVGAHTVVGRVQAGQTRWRSEAVWRAQGEDKQLRFTKGQKLRFQFNVRMTNVNKNPNAESVIWQLVGRTTKKTWPGPPISISVSGSEFHIGGGSHTPDASGRESRDREKYFKPDHVALDNRTYSFEVSVLLGGPSTGRVSVSIDGAAVVDNQPMPAGTWFEAGDYTHEWVYAKNGFYGGSSAPIATPMSVTHTDLRLSVTNPDGSTRSYRH